MRTQNTETDDRGHETVSTEYRVAIRFSYQVAGREFHSGNWKWGWTAIYGSREKPTAIVAGYPVGKSVQVFYDPTEPATAVLEPANRQGSLVQLVFSLVFEPGFRPGRAVDVMSVHQVGRLRRWGDTEFRCT